MITLVLIALIGTALFFASLPVVLFALMMETCVRRTTRTGTKLFLAPLPTPRHPDLVISGAAKAA